MKENKLSILTTRPLVHGTMLDAAEKGIQIEVASFIETKSTIDSISGKRILQLSNQEVAIVFTSMNAAEAVIDTLQAMNTEPGWTIYTLGGVTGSIVEKFFTGSEIFASAINAKGVAQNVLDNEENEVVFFCGNQRRDELPSFLQQHNIKVEEIVVYQTIETPVKLSRDFDGILFFSPSAVQSFFSLNKVAPATVLFAIGTTTAAEIKKFTDNKLLVGTQPHKETLAEQAMDYLLNR